MQGNPAKEVFTSVFGKTLSLLMVGISHFKFMKKLLYFTLLLERIYKTGYCSIGRGSEVPTV